MTEKVQVELYHREEKMGGKFKKRNDQKIIVSKMWVEMGGRRGRGLS